LVNVSLWTAKIILLLQEKCVRLGRVRTTPTATTRFSFLPDAQACRRSPDASTKQGRRN